MFDAASNTDVSLSELQARLAELIASNQKLASERDQYRQLYLETLELCRKLELGLLGQKREKLSGDDAQLTLALLSMLTGKGAGGEKPAEKAASSPVRAHERAKPTGRKPLPETLPRIDIEVLPPEVQREGLDAFERIGEDTTETVERRVASLVVVRHIRPIFVRKDRDLKFEVDVHQAPPPELPIERGLAGPGLLAETIVKRWEDHLPLHRMERIYGRDGLQLARSTICGWHAELANLAKPLIEHALRNQDESLFDTDWVTLLIPLARRATLRFPEPLPSIIVELTPQQDSRRSLAGFRAKASAQLPLCRNGLRAD